VYRDWKLEASAFRGREPDQYRYNIETGAIDSWSARLSLNPTPAWALQVSYGHIHSPEQLDPDIDVNRTTASAIYNHRFAGNEWQTTLAWGRDAPSRGITTNAYLLESALHWRRTHTVFGRLERVDKDELFLPTEPLADEVFRIKKLTLGYVYDFPSQQRYRIGVGGLVSFYALPSDLDPVYGHPTSYMIFARIKLQ
jgi:hypothetical protein